MGAPILTSSTNVSGLRPLLQGIASPNAIVHVYLAGGSQLFGTPKADANGNWKLQLTQDLPFTTYDPLNIALAEHNSMGQRTSDWTGTTLTLTASGTGPVGQSDSLCFNGTVDNVEAIKRVGNWFTNNTRQPTGFYLPAGIQLQLYLTFTRNPTGNAKPELHVGAPDTNPNTANWNTRIYPLHAGQNLLSDPDGGMIYFSMTGVLDSVHILFQSGMIQAPYFELGKTNPLLYRQMLQNLVQSPQAELVSKRAIVTVKRQAALLYQHLDPDTLMHTYEEIISVVENFMGLDGSTPLHTRAPLRYHLSHGNYLQVGWARTGHSYLVYADAAAPELLDPKQLIGSWGIAHEFGHQNQMLAYLIPELAETTNNLVSLAVERHYRRQSTLLNRDANGLTVWDTAIAKRTGRTPSLNDFNVYELLIPLEQLRLGYGESFWPRVNKVTRERWSTNGLQPDRDTAGDNLVLFCSIAASADLRNFFKSWGFVITVKGEQAIKALQLPAPRSDLAILGT